jgi:hypothetical protein
MVEALYIPLSMALSLEEYLRSRLPNDQILVHCYSVGRCGSTLLSRAMDATPYSQSLSEPDIFTRLTSYGPAHSSLSVPEHTTKLVTLLRCSIITLLYFCHTTHPTKKVVSIKYRSSGVGLAYYIRQAYPPAKNVFLYRDAYNHNESFTRAFTNAKTREEFQSKTLTREDVWSLSITQHMRCIEWVDHEGFGSQIVEKVFREPEYKGYVWGSFFFWLQPMETATRLKNAYPSFFDFTLTYDELVEGKDGVISTLFKRVGVELNEQESKVVRAVFSRNSQEGSGIESKRLGNENDVSWYGENERKLLESYLAHHDGLVDSLDYKLSYVNNKTRYNSMKWE